MNDWQKLAKEYLASPPQAASMPSPEYTEDVMMTPPLDLEPKSENVQLGPIPAVESDISHEDMDPLRLLEGAIQQVNVPEAGQPTREGHSPRETEFFQVNVMPEDFSGSGQSMDTGYQELLLGGE